MDVPFGSWGTQTFIAGLSAEALIATWVIKGAMDGEAFKAYVEQVLVPELEPGTVVILPSHRCKQRLPGNGQPVHTQERRRCQSHARSRMLVPVLAALQSRPEPNRDGILQTQRYPSGLPALTTDGEC